MARRRGGAQDARVPFRRSLSGRLLLLTALFVLIAEVLIFAPSIARYRLVWLQQRVDAGMLATLALDSAPGGRVTDRQAARLLEHAMVDAVVLRTADRSMFMLAAAMPPPVDATFDLRDAAPAALVADAFGTLFSGPDRTLRVLDDSRVEPGVTVEVVLGQGELYRSMAAFSLRILRLSIVISLIAAALVYLSLHVSMVRPMRLITANLLRFGRRPEDASRQIPDTARADEIGMAQRALGEVERELRRALLQKTRLAALGEAIGKINHDLRNTLAFAALESDGLAASDDPRVRRAAPRLMAALDRAAQMCARILDYAQAGEPGFRPETLSLAALIDEAGAALAADGGGTPRAAAWENHVPRELVVRADRLQLFRVIQNLGRNALEAMPDGGAVRFTAAARDGETAIDVVDTGPGIPERARAALFRPFAGSARPGGAGLGLAIARENMRLHGGDVTLMSTGPGGTHMRLVLPRQRGAAGAIQ